MATVKEKTISKEIFFTNVIALLYDGHEFWGAGYDKNMA